MLSFLKPCFICILLLLIPLLPGCFSKTKDRDKSPKRVLTKRALKCLIAVKEGSTSLTTPLTSWNRLYLDGGLGGKGVTKGQNFSTLLWSSSVSAHRLCLNHQDHKTPPKQFTLKKAGTNDSLAFSLLRLRLSEPHPDKVSGHT